MLEAIEKKLGKINLLYENICFPDINLTFDIYWIEATEKKPFITLITVGMSSKPMNISDETKAYCELMISLPLNFDLDNKENRWVVTELINRAYYPFIYFNYYYNGCIENNFMPFSENIDFSGFLLLSPEGKNIKFLNKVINLYQLIPIYEEEYNYILKNGFNNFKKFLEKEKINLSPVVDISRKRMIFYTSEDLQYKYQCIDCDKWHLLSFENKELNVDKINVYNHMAIYLRWALENDLLNHSFLVKYARELKESKQDNPNLKCDLRYLLKDKLNGILKLTYFNEIGIQFSKYFYYYENCSCDDNFYPIVIENYVKKILGEKNYYSEELKREALLFIEFNEKYYQDIKKIIDKKFKEWRKNN